ncbi:MAG: EAL domain-containing protein [Pseudomonadota bacterium]
MARLAGIKNFLNSLIGRMALGVLLIHALLAPLMFGGMLFIVKQAYEAQFINHVRSEARLIATLAERDLDIPDLRVHLDDVLLGSTIVYAQVVKEDGSIYYQSGTAPDEFKEDFFFGDHDDSTYYIAVPIQHDGRMRAVLRLGYDEQPVKEQISNAYRRAINLGVVYVILTLALVTFFGWQITQSLRRLRDAAHQVVTGDIARQLDIATGISEITSLGRDLERMRWKLVHQGELLEHQALHDSLTGLPNRALLRDRLQQALSAAPRNGKAIALLMIDLDRFKEVNDTLGHQIGDLLLQNLALRLRGTLRESDTVARLGGDEFAVLLPAVDNTQHAAIAAQKILKLLETPIDAGEHSLLVGGSIGIALAPEHGADIETLMRRADLAMYYAKRTHGGYCIYHADLDQQMAGELNLLDELRRAVEHRQLALHYQPKIDLRTAKVVSVEALLRWQHPQRGLLTPAAFLPAAEKSGLINDITYWVLEEALQQCRRWRQAGSHLPVAINLSARSLQNPALPEQITTLLHKSGIEPAALELEINESIILMNPAHTLEMLGHLHDLGVRLSIDDYGTAASSLQYLNQLPMHQIKIDKSFIGDLENKGNARVVRAAIDLAHDMGRTAIAEGVESLEALKRLQALGCDMAQGYHVSPPLPADELMQWLHTSQWR